MAALATATLVRRGASDVVVVNRTPDRAGRLAREHGVRAAPLTALAEEVRAADLVVACTGSIGTLVTWSMIEALARPAGLVDLALPHDVEPDVRDLPYVTMVTLADLADDLRDSEAGAEVDAVRGSSPRRSRRSSPPGCRPTSRRPSSPCARWPPRSSTPSWPAC